MPGRWEHEMTRSAPAALGDALDHLWPLRPLDPNGLFKTLTACPLQSDDFDDGVT